MSVKDNIKSAYNLELDDLKWLPYHPNNMKGNPEDGLYCIIPIKHEDGSYSARKYTIMYQYAEDLDGVSHPEEIELYILFDKTYLAVEGSVEYPDLLDSSCLDCCENCGAVTFTNCDINDFGRFVRAFSTLKGAKKRALRQFKAVECYVASHLLSDEELGELKSELEEGK